MIAPRSGRITLALFSSGGHLSEHFRLQFPAQYVRVNTMNGYLFDLLRRIEEGARRLASTITGSGETRLRDIALVEVELE